MQLALTPVAPFVLLGFAAVTERSVRAANSGRRRKRAIASTIASAVPVVAACRVDVDLDAVVEVEPVLADARRPTGVAVLRLDITATGDVRDLEILSSSGFPVLDSAALALAQVARMEAPREGQYRATIVFTE
ncbi:MAG: hypothetical protein NVSMB21_15800 [Vulcanimicrobiaceae bacterium]